MYILQWIYLVSIVIIKKKTFTVTVPNMLVLSRRCYFLVLTENFDWCNIGVGGH